MPDHDPASAAERCARELRQIGDQLYWRQKLLEMLVRNRRTVAGVK